MKRKDMESMRKSEREREKSFQRCKERQDGKTTLIRIKQLEQEKWWMGKGKKRLLEKRERNGKRERVR